MQKNPKSALVCSSLLLMGLNQCPVLSSGIQCPIPGAVAGAGGHREHPPDLQGWHKPTWPGPALVSWQDWSFPAPFVWLTNLPCQRKAWKKPRHSCLKCQKHGNAGEILGVQSPGPAQPLEQLQHLPLEFLSSTGTGVLFSTGVLRKAAAETSPGLEISRDRCWLPWEFTAPFLRQAAGWEQRCAFLPSPGLIPGLRAALSDRAGHSDQAVLSDQAAPIVTRLHLQ